LEATRKIKQENIVLKKISSARAAPRDAELSGYLLTRARGYRYPVEVNLKGPLRCLQHDLTILAAVDVVQHFPGDWRSQSPFEVLTNKANCVSAIHDPDGNSATVRRPPE
jgi:hypothetical protein